MNKTNARFSAAFVLAAALVIGLVQVAMGAAQICTSPTFVGLTQFKTTLWECPADTPTISVSATAAPATATATLAPSAIPTATNTATPTQTASPTPTSSPLPTLAPTITATVPVVGMQPVKASILGTCTAAVHDRYVVVVNGNTYRTWHPQVVPIDPTNPAAGTCVFAHEHGDNPTTSLANSSLPAFERIGQLAGFNEPHEGFKVFVQPRGAVNNDTRTNLTDNRLVVHMGAGGAARFYTQFHSIMIDVVSPDGHYVHVQGMGDAGGVDTICGNRSAKTAMAVPGTTSCVPQSDYEIWIMHFTVMAADGKTPIVTALGSPAVFDPISLFNPLDVPGVHPLWLTKDFAAQLPKVFGLGPWKGCKREAYVGPIYWYNKASEQTVFQTDAYGHVQAGGPLTQSVSLHSDIGIAMTTDFGISPDQTQFKLLSNHCADAPFGSLGDLN